MRNDFISQQDRILVAAIELISESGLGAFTLKNLAMKGNIQEAVVYKYFGGIDEVLVAVVEFFVKFDQNIMDTVASKDCSMHDKVLYFFDTYATYYGNYKEISAVILHYEELLHRSGTRELIAQCIQERSKFLTDVIESGKAAGEVREDIDAKHFADMMISVMNGMILNRRVMNCEETLKQQLLTLVEAILSCVIER